MTENDPLRSGSRWEPWPGSDRAGTAVPDAAAATTEFLATDGPSPRGRRGLRAAAGAGMLLLGGRPGARDSFGDGGHGDPDGDA